MAIATEILWSFLSGQEALECCSPQVAGVGHDYVTELTFSNICERTLYILVIISFSIKTQLVPFTGYRYTIFKLVSYYSMNNLKEF